MEGATNRPQLVKIKRYVILLQVYYNHCREVEKVTNLPEYWRMIDDTIKIA